MGRGKDLTTTELNEMKSLLNEGLSYGEVAELLGRTKKSIANAAFRHNLKDKTVTKEKKETPKEWESELVKKVIENTNKIEESVVKPQLAKERTLKDFSFREIIKYLWDNNYRWKDMYCIIKQPINVEDIIKNG